MNILHHVRAMAAYNRWMNGNLYDAGAKLSDEARKRDMGAFFKSIHGTLNHILLADRIWLGRFLDQPAHFKSLDQELYSDFTELCNEREKTDQVILAWVASLTDQDTERILTYVSVSNPVPKSIPLWFAISHFFNHQTHHRGQITTLLFQQGIDPGITDLPWMPDFKP